ncbi:MULTISPECIES: DNA-binding transcriptional regulator [unclassified Lentimonas]|uniref:AraC family transcriptional regulator n=1 Tax=unclassified Lentimonas TaxID=2630993 RepID=UPI00132911A6|nr:MULTISPECIES: DNA-binding transcriptional regulator [unclassified Lentimonas]CAA6690719.1 Unannotated [Lentimonas sp. CC19]CAA6693339.1 Unannotated [Lentimonas sp. CC10]CAA7071818.1 Unannotated [Lentimonas sp. CC11]
MDTPKVAILVDTATGWGRRVIRGVLDHRLEHGIWDITIQPNGPNDPFDFENLSEFDGVIARVSTPEILKTLKRLKIPTVNVSGIKLEGCTFTQITTDRFASARLAEAHFRDRSFTHFAYIGPLGLKHVRAQERAFEEALEKSGTACHVYHPDPKSKISNQWIPNEDRLIAWLQSLPKPVGIYTWAFEIGRTIVSACRKANIPVPHDVAVLGGDYDELLSDACHPALSGIVCPAEQIGKRASIELDKQMNGNKSAGSKIYIPAEDIEERLSTETLAIADKQIKQALTYIRAHACEEISVEDILTEVPMARRSLERRFTQYIGRTPALEIRRIRINHVRKLLAKTDMTMQEIAEACGYSGYNYLGMIFKKETGMSPGAYRNRARG